MDPQTPQVPPKPKKSNLWVWILGIVGGLGAIGVCGCLGVLGALSNGGTDWFTSGPPRDAKTELVGRGQELLLSDSDGDADGVSYLLHVEMKDKTHDKGVVQPYGYNLLTYYDHTIDLLLALHSDGIARVVGTVHTADTWYHTEGDGEPPLGAEIRESGGGFVHRRDWYQGAWVRSGETIYLTLTEHSLQSYWVADGERTDNSQEKETIPAISMKLTLSQDGTQVLIGSWASKDKQIENALAIDSTMRLLEHPEP